MDTASITDGQFVVSSPFDPGGDISAGILSIYIKNMAEPSASEYLLHQEQVKAGATITVMLDDVIAILDDANAQRFDAVYATWQFKGCTSESADKPLDVGTVEVLAGRRISNYFSPEWNGQWGGPAKTIGMYQTWPNVTPVTKNMNLFNAMDLGAEGLAMDGNTVIRFHQRAEVGGITRWIGNQDGQGYYVENPDRDQANTSGAAQNAGLFFLRATSVAVRTNADRLSFGCRVYIPEFKIRTVDDSGGLHGNTDQIDVWRGQGDQALKDVVDNWGNAEGVKIKTCLKIIEQE